MEFIKKRYEVIDSTNDEAIRQIEKGNIRAAIYLANRQTKGRGRGSHIWQSEHMGNIYSSYAFEVGNNIRYLPQLTLLTALGIIRALNEIKPENKDNIDIKIKWPNDVLVNNKKIAGILTEVASYKNNYYAIVGVGINVDWSEDEIRGVDLEYAGAISQLFDNRYMVDEVQEAVENQLIVIFREFLSGSYFDKYYDEYDGYLINKCRQLTCELNNQSITGLCLGVDEQGFLLIENNNEIIRVNSGEVNVKGIYGM